MLTIYKKLYALVLPWLIFFAIRIVPANAETLTVISLADDGSAGTLRSLVTKAHSGDIIDFALGLNGTITLNGTPISSANKSLTIQGPGAAIVEVSGNKNSGVFEFTGSSVSLSGLTISNGKATGLGGGGGIVCNSMHLSISNCTVSGNSAKNGGGLSAFGALTEMNNCIISQNTANDNGGGIYGDRESTLQVYNTTISHNKSNDSGGGIFDGRNAALVNCTLYKNTAKGLGGGCRGSTSMFSCTVYANSSELSGGGISGGPYICNTILAGNIAPSAPDFGGPLFGHYNIIQHDEPSRIDGGLGNIVGLDPHLGVLANNGGATPTLALLPGSPATNKGDLDFGPELIWDQRGVGFPRIKNGRIDIGALEGDGTDSPNSSLFDAVATKNPLPPSTVRRTYKDRGVLKTYNGLTTTGSQTLLTLFSNGVALENQRFEFSVSAVAKSGGHDHDDGINRPHGWITETNASNVPLKDSGPSGSTASTFIATSDANGNVKYTAPEMSGEELVVIRALDNPTFPSARITLFVQHPESFVELPASHPYIELIDGTHSHGPNNWFGTPNLIQATMALAKLYHADFGKLLPVNDMSLPLGGLFDIGPKQGLYWSTPHGGHRRGVNVDIDIKPRLPNFDKILADQGWWEKSHKESTHDHLTVSHPGKVTIKTLKVLSSLNTGSDPDYPGAARWRIFIEIQNRGGLDAVNVTTTGIETQSGIVALQYSLDGLDFRAVNPTSPLSLGSLDIGEKKTVTVDVMVPLSTRVFGLAFKGSASSATGNTDPVQMHIDANETTEFVLDETPVPVSTVSGTCINGRVTDIHGIGVSGVAVESSGKTINGTTTNTDGFFCLNGLQAGLIKITPSKTGYDFLSPNKSVLVGNDANASADFTALAAPSITGRVIDSNSNGVANLQVNLTDTNSEVSTMTNEDGYYAFSVLANETYEVEPAADSGEGPVAIEFEPFSRHILAATGSSTGVDFVIKDINIAQIASISPNVVSRSNTPTEMTISGAALSRVSDIEFWREGHIDETISAKFLYTDATETRLVSEISTSESTSLGACDVVLINPAGRSEPKEAAITIVADTSAPTIDVLVPANASNVTSLTRVTGTAADNVAVSSVDFTLKRASDGKFWTGSTWGASTALATELSGTGVTRNWSRSSGLPTGTDLPPDSYTLMATATDTANNKASLSRAFSVYVADAIKPVVTVTAPANASSSKALTFAGGTASDNGSGLAKVTLTLQRLSDSQYWSGTAWAATAPPLPAGLSGATWTKSTFPAAGTNVSTQLTEGKYTLAATATDKAGNVSAVTAASKTTFTIDRTVPSSLTIINPAGPAKIKVLPKINGTATDNNVVASVVLTYKRNSDNKFWTGTAWGAQTELPTNIAGPVNNRTWSKSTGLPAGTDLPLGNYGIFVTAIDAAGNRTTVSRSFNITETVPPTATITSPANASTVNAFAQITGTANDLGGSNLQKVALTLRRLSDSKFWNGSEWVATSFDLSTSMTTATVGVTWKCLTLPKNASLIDGGYRAQATATDKAGNLGPTVVSQFTLRRTAAPAARASSVQLSSVRAGMDGTIQLVFAGALTAATDVLDYNLTLNGEPIEIVSVQQKSPSVVVLSTEGLTPGTKLAVSYSLQDAMGGSVVGTANVTVK